jgi:hypothetical protein
VTGSAVRTIGLALAAAIVLASGVRLTRSGRPYGSALLNVHKLVDLAAVVVIGLAAYQANRSAPFSGVEWLVLATGAVLVVATFASGGAITGMSQAPAAALRVHRIGSWIAAALAAASVYLIASR